MTTGEFHRLLERAGIDDTKPLFAVLTTLHDAALETREIVGSGARGLTPEGEARLIRRVVETVGEGAEHHVDRLAWRVGFWNTARLALAGLALCVGGYLVGHYQAAARQAEVMNGAAFVAQVAALNDGASLKAYCATHSFPQAGGVACNLPPIWVRR